MNGSEQTYLIQRSTVYEVNGSLFNSNDELIFLVKDRSERRDYYLGILIGFPIILLIIGILTGVIGIQPHLISYNNQPLPPYFYLIFTPIILFAVIFLILFVVRKKLIIKSTDNEVIGSVKSNIRKSEWIYEQSDKSSVITIKFENDSGFITSGELNYNISRIREKKERWSKILEIRVESETTENKFTLKKKEDEKRKSKGKYFEIVVYGKVNPLFLFVFSTVAIKKFFTQGRYIAGGMGNL